MAYWVKYTRDGVTKVRAFHLSQDRMFALCERWDRGGFYSVGGYVRRFTDAGTVTVFADTRAEAERA